MVRVGHHQEPQPVTEAQKHKAVLFGRVVRVIDQQGVIVCKDSLSLGKRYSMFPPVLGLLPDVPLEPEVRNTYIVTTTYALVKSLSFCA